MRADLDHGTIEQRADDGWMRKTNDEEEKLFVGEK